MEQALIDLTAYTALEGWLGQFAARALRNTQLYQQGDIPRAIWRSLLIQDLALQNSDLNIAQLGQKAQIDNAIDRILRADGAELV